MRSYETLAKNWASFLNEKVLKVKAKKDLITKTQDKLNNSQNLTSVKVTAKKPKAITKKTKKLSLN